MPKRKPTKKQEKNRNQYIGKSDNSDLEPFVLTEQEFVDRMRGITLAHSSYLSGMSQNGLDDWMKQALEASDAQAQTN